MQGCELCYSTVAQDLTQVDLINSSSAFMVDLNEKLGVPKIFSNAFLSSTFTVKTSRWTPPLHTMSCDAHAAHTVPLLVKNNILRSGVH